MTSGTGPASNVYLTGFSYTGKTTVARLLAERLGRAHLDIDDEIERRVGRPIPDVFRSEGEAYFREIETHLLQELAEESGKVVSTGGGIVVDPINRDLMNGSGTVVCLEARPETILGRLRLGNDDQSARPLLQHAQPLDEIRLLKSRRQRHYAEAHVTVHTDVLDPDEVVDAVIGQLRKSTVPRHPSSTKVVDPDVAYAVETDVASYPIVVRPGALKSLGQRMRGLGLSGTAHVITDAAINASYGRAAIESLNGAGYPARVFPLPSGEASKTVEKAGELYGWLAAGRAERQDVIVAVGGGVTGDLAGFVAATYARGLSFVQVPTTILAMADAAIGGKVAVDLPAGKNLVGAFYQPALVLADVSVLATLPTRDRIAGLAEVVKTGLIADENLVSFLEANVGALLEGDDETMRHALARCAAIKGHVVSVDERETTGLRATLNYGHTLGHAIETVTGYESVLHGEAVAMGMSFAGRLAANVGSLTESDLARQEALIASFGLPMRPPREFGADPVKEAMRLDKKVEGGANRWILLDRLGHARLRNDVDQEAVDETLEEFFGDR